jgi:hypothetical protein
VMRCIAESIKNTGKCDAMGSLPQTTASSDFPAGPLGRPQAEISTHVYGTGNFLRRLENITPPMLE